MGGDIGRRRIALAACLPAAIMAAAPALADPYSVRIPAIQLAVPAALPAQERNYRVGDTVLDLPLLWSSAATLLEPVTAEADGQSERLAAGTLLPVQRLASASHGPTVTAYCTVRRAAERAADRNVIGQALFGALTRRVVQSLTDRQLCLLDSDNDGRLDQSLVVGDGSPEARTPRAIAPAGMRVADLVPISSGNRIRLELTGVGRRGDSLNFLVHIEQEGHDRVFDIFGGSWGQVERRPRLRFGRGMPAEANMLGATLHVSNIDGPGRSVRLRWTGHADPGRAIVVPDGLRYERR
jgi:hypothetical protein